MVIAFEYPHFLNIVRYTVFISVCPSVIFDNNVNSLQGLFQQFREKAPGQNLEKMIDLISKLGEIKDIES